MPHEVIAPYVQAGYVDEGYVSEPDGGVHVDGPLFGPALARSVVIVIEIDFFKPAEGGEELPT